jgi:hypothetical protein
MGASPPRGAGQLQQSLTNYLNRSTAQRGRRFAAAPLGLLVCKSNLTEPHLEDITCGIQMSCIHEMLEAVSIETYRQLWKTVRKLILRPSHNTSNLVEVSGAMAENTRVNRLEILCAKQIGSSLLLRGDWRVGDWHFGSRGHRPNI